MNILKTLTVTALLGTQKQTPAPIQAEGRIADLLTAIQEDADASPAARLLRQAGVVSLCQQAGFLPTTAAVPATTAAPAETDTVAPSASFSLLTQIFESNYERLHVEALQYLSNKQLCLPPALLPTVLQLGQRLPAVKQRLAPVLGERGRWLISQNTAWHVPLLQYESLPDESVWQLGSLAERQVYLSILRQQDPAQARARLSESLKELDARERATLLAVMKNQLSLEDESFLNALCQDRSKEVRNLAVQLLSQLPQSAYSQRMQTRLAQCLTVAEGEPAPKPGVMNTLKRLVQSKDTPSTSLILTPPEVFFEEGKADLLEEKPPANSHFGAKAWWLHQLVNLVPLDWWQSKTGMSPEALLHWARENDWRDALYQAWYQATLREQNAAWATAFLAQPPIEKFYLDTSALSNLLPLAMRETYWLQTIQANMTPPKQLTHLPQILFSIMQAYDFDTSFGPVFSKQMLQHVRTYITQSKHSYDYYIREIMQRMACLLPLDLLEEAQSNWPEVANLNQNIQEALSEYMLIISLRQQLHQLFK